jgi:ABC-2 type transport system permease protein
VALGMMFRRKLFWVIYAFGLLSFLVFFFGQYLLAWAEAQAGEQSVVVGPIRVKPEQLTGIFRNVMRLNGTGESYRIFFAYQGYMVMIVLALAGTLLVGNDLQFRSLPFYLSKPVSPWHYLVGKCLAVGVFVNLMTTLPALVLFFQYRVLYSWSDDLLEEVSLLFGIIGYGLVLTVFLSLLLVAMASWLRRTVPLIMGWTTLFLFMRLVTTSLTGGLGWHVNWRLLDLWNDTYVVGCALLQTDAGYNPDWELAALTLVIVSVLCVKTVTARIRAVEVV